MVATGIVRKIDKNGRVVIPKSVLKKIGFTEDQPLEFFFDGSAIMLAKLERKCDLCAHDNMNNLMQVGDKLICKNCISQINKLAPTGS